MVKIEIFFNSETQLIETRIISGKNEFKKRNKGNSILQFPEEFIAIDIETTGLDPDFSEIIEVCAIKVRNNKEIDRFQSLIKPEKEIDDFITNLTGITNEMLQNAPIPEDVMAELRNFIGHNILIAHNAHFDINFLYDYFKKLLNIEFNNDFVCTMRVARRVFPDFENHKLITICEKLNIEPPIHRAENDAIAVWKIYAKCKQKIIDDYGSIDEFLKSIGRKSKGLQANQIKPDVENFDIEHPVYRKNFVFTGTLSKMLRREAMQLVVNLGGKCLDNVTRETDFLVMGIQDYSRFSDGKKSNKTKKAEQLKLKGYDLQIISEDNFYDLILGA